MATSTKKKPAPRARRPAAPVKRATPAPAAAKPVATRKVPPTVQAATAAKAGKAQKGADKPKKPKLVRDSFTLPKSEYAVLELLKNRAAKAGTPAKKSEVLRAGIQALASMQDGAFLAAIAAVPTLKTGRPAKT